jgi:hypothetical protein
MNRFLAGLIDRAEGRAPVLQRRARALFEPDAQGSVRPVESFEQTEMQDRTPRNRSASPSESARLSRDHERVELHADSDRHHPSAIRARSDDAGARVARVGDEARHRGALQPDEHVPPIRTRLVPAPDGDPAPHRSPPREPAAERSAPPVQAVQHATKDERQRKRPEAPVAERLVVQRERRVEVPPAVTRTRIVERVSTSPSMRRSSATPPVASRSAVLLAKSQTSTQVRRERQSLPAPAPVQITIGRVEVRAVAAKGERAPASAPAGPRLSLDEYLRQRNGAAR